MGIPHVVAVPYPAQGHVIPLLELSQRLIKEGIKVTFVNTDFNHKRVLYALANKDCLGDQLSLVSIPDGLEPGEDRNEVGKLSIAIFEAMPRKLEELIEKINSSGKDGKITCVLSDVNMGWAFEVAKKLGIAGAAFCPASAAALSSAFCIPKLLDDGIINEHGTPIKKEEKIRLASEMPLMNPADLSWACFEDFTTRKIIFDLVAKNNRTIKLAEWIVCNSTYELELGAFTCFPNILPIGPLLARDRLGDSLGYFWPENLTCLKWLDQQPPHSVTYVAFGSFTVFDQTQFQELAHGLELSNRPFLWVVRPDLSGETNQPYPEGFQERVSNRGHFVSWAPQQKVLSHPSIACFVSHCGWNSTIEGVSNGVPFLCWPYFCDQFHNESYICDVWKVGLRFNRNEKGIITRDEIKNNVEQLLCDVGYKARAMELNEVIKSSLSDDGRSRKNLKSFINWIKAQGSEC